MAFSYNNEGEQQSPEAGNRRRGRGFRFTPKLLVIGMLLAMGFPIEIYLYLFIGII